MSTWSDPTLSPATPVLVGAGQFAERLGTAAYRQLCAPDIAAAAARRACEDTGAAAAVLAAVDAIVTTRTFEDSTPRRAQPFGKSDNFPRSIARRLGIDPPLAIWEKSGGNTPQQLVAECFERLASGELKMVLLAGAENISTARWLQSQGKAADWSESVPGAVDDRGMGLYGWVTSYNLRHGLVGTATAYGLCEHARRRTSGLQREAYAHEMGQLFAPFTQVAAAHPHRATDLEPMDAAALLRVGERNRMIADPYPQRLVARDQVNQGAALVMTTVGMARSLGIDPGRWVFLHGHAALQDRELMQRQDLGAFQAGVMASRQALQRAGIGVAEVRFFDFYSCYPVAVSSVAIDGLGLRCDDARGLTVTGGLPYFGGPGNNYATHAIATMVERLRACPGSYGFVGANGGFLSKYAAGVYSTRAAPFKPAQDEALQAQIDAAEAPVLAEQPDGWATIETYTVSYGRDVAELGIVVGRTARGERFLATTEEGDSVTLQALLAEEPLGRRIYVRCTHRGNRFAFTMERMDEVLPLRPAVLRDDYAFVRVEREGRLLVVTINRPESRNSLHPMANEELDEVWNAYEADRGLWVAIVTGAGQEAFCAGNDLKYTASGKPLWIPRSGFGGLTSRVRSKPVIAAVNGAAMGGGTEMALACDLVVADERASFALSEVRVGWIAAAGGLVRLPRQMPKKIAVEHILTGRAMSAQVAQQWGLVNHLVPAGQALQGARRLAAEILAASPTSVRLSLQVMNEADAVASEAQAAARRSAALDELFTSEDFVEGPKAFSEKRAPAWKNR